jgi:hypothetical protein
LLAQGVQALVGFEFGWLFRIVERERLILSGSLELSNADLTVINVLNWLEGILEGAHGPDNSIVVPSNSLRGSGGLHLGYALSQLFGLRAGGFLGVGEGFDRRGDSGWHWEVEGAVDLNLYPKTSVPMGFVLGGEISSFPETGDDLSQKSTRGFLRIAYTGRPDFVVGVDLSVERIPLSFLDHAIVTNSAAIELRYYF